MSNDKLSTNPLFSPGNVLNFTNNSVFMPVQEQQASAILSPEKDMEEEGSFMGQSTITTKQQNVATFTLFSQTGEPAPTADPFAGVSSLPPMMDKSMLPTTNSKVVTSVQHEPQLFVPPPSPLEQNKPAATSLPNPISSSVPLSSMPPSDTANVPRANPYSRVATGGHRPRPMFPSSNQFYQASPAPQAVPPNPQSPYTNPAPGGATTEFLQDMKHPPSEIPAATMVPPPPTSSQFYQPVVPHWFYCKDAERSRIWSPFSQADSSKLELLFQAELKGGATNDTISTDGGRYDVTLSQRIRRSVYWDEPNSNVRRCTWFYKGDNESRFSPYEEDLANKLEMEYETVVKKGIWHKAIDIGSKETVVVHNPQLIVHYQPDPFGTDFGGVHEKQQRSKIVKRGIIAAEFATELPGNEPGVADHLVFFCHGVGPVCDLRSRSIVECVDDFRAIHLSLLDSHFKKATEEKEAQRIEFLPIHWHRALHGDATGVDRNIRRLTLPSISRLRHFTNETLLDILFYSSPVYCQTIAETVGNEINSLYQRFMARNPDFTGKVSLAGHSLGSLILFDLLCHQSDASATIGGAMPASVPPQVANPMASNGGEVPEAVPTDKHTAVTLTLEEALEQLNLSSFQDKFECEQMDMDTLLMCSEDDLKSIGLPLGPRKKLMGFLKEYEQSLSTAATSSPPAQQAVPDTPKLTADAGEPLEPSVSILSNAMNVHVDFQQFDSGTGQPFVSYPRLDFQPHSLFALGSPIGMFLTVRGIDEMGEDFSLPTCPNFINIFHPFDPVAYRVEPLVNPDCVLKPVLVPHHKGRKRLHLELKESLGRMGQELKEGIMRSVKLAIGSMQRFANSHWNQAEAAVEEEVQQAAEELMRNGQEANEGEDTGSASSDSQLDDVGFGKLNGGRRIDYVLQERPLESFNDYLFAFQSHLCYWNSEDTVLLMLKEVYGSMGVSPDSKKLPAAPPSP